MRNEMKTLAIIHTTEATISLLKGLAEELLPKVNVINLLDDSMLPDMLAGKDEAVKVRWLTYAQMAVEAGADIILSACSTVGRFAEIANSSLAIPVWRIDQEMVSKAVQQGGRVGILATLSSTLEPTLDLVKRQAAEQGKSVHVEAVLVEGAYEALMSGDRAKHDQKIIAAAKEIQPKCDLLLLAQASMSRALESFTVPENFLVLTSPRMALEKMKYFFEADGS